MLEVTKILFQMPERATPISGVEVLLALLNLFRFLYDPDDGGGGGVENTILEKGEIFQWCGFTLHRSSTTMRQDRDRRKRRRRRLQRVNQRPDPRSDAKNKC